VGCGEPGGQRHHQRPCHGSRFTITTGAVVARPAPGPLPEKRIEVADGKVVRRS
jgi:Rieske Fe-S protein